MSNKEIKVWFMCVVAHSGGSEGLEQAAIRSFE
jgi:hypothetical protein